MTFCPDCRESHERDETCQEARDARYHMHAERARAAIAEAKSHLCSHGNRLDQCGQPHDRPTAAPSHADPAPREATDG